MNIKNNKKAILVTGATSYLGRNLIKFLLKKGYDVFAIVRKNSKNINYINNISGLNILYYDMNDKIDESTTFIFINEIKNKYNNIYIYHLAWDSKSELGRNDEILQKSNFENSKNIINLAKILDAKRLIFTSSQADKGDTAYGRYKKAFSEFGKANFPHFVIARVFSVYGKDDEKKTLITYIKKCEKNREKALLGPCDKMWNYLYIDDFSYIMEKLLNDNLNENLIYDIASDDTRILKDYILNGGAKIDLSFNNNIGNNETFFLPDISNITGLLDNNFKFKTFNIHN